MLIDDFYCNCDFTVLIKQFNMNVELLMNETFVLSTNLIAFLIPTKVFIANFIYHNIKLSEHT